MIRAWRSDSRWRSNFSPAEKKGGDDDDVASLLKNGPSPVFPNRRGGEGKKGKQVNEDADFAYYRQDKGGSLLRSYFL